VTSPTPPGIDHQQQVVLRPFASPLPLGFFSFGIGMALLGGLGLGWLSSAQDVRAAGVLMAAFVFPLELVAAIIAVLTRDTGAATTLGLYTTSWLGLGLLDVLDPTQQTSRTVGLFLIAFAIMLVPLAVAAAFGKVLLTVVLSVSIIRAVLQGAHEWGAPAWVDTANGVVALTIFVLAWCAGTAFLVEDLRGRTPLVPRRGQARTAISESGAQPEPGVRQQL
jgi:succinate-acetate transporter protein